MQADKSKERDNRKSKNIFLLFKQEAPNSLSFLKRETQYYGLTAK